VSFFASWWQHHHGGLFRLTNNSSGSKNNEKWGQREIEFRDNFILRTKNVSAAEAAIHFFVWKQLKN